MLKKIVLGTFLFLLLLITLSFIPVGSTDPKPEMEIYLISNEIHTDFALPVKNDIFDWETFLDPKDFKNRPSGWIEIGWGDRQFYFEMPTRDKFSFRLAADALFSPDPAVIHVNYLDAHPEFYATAQKVRISYKTYQKLVKELKGRFLQQQGKPILIPGKGYSTTDNFYEAEGLFSILRTCNSWTSEILGEVGLKHPLWSPTKYGLQFVWSD